MRLLSYEGYIIYGLSAKHRMIVVALEDYSLLSKTAKATVATGLVNDQLHSELRNSDVLRVKPNLQTDSSYSTWVHTDRCVQKAG